MKNPIRKGIKKEFKKYPKRSALTIILLFTLIVAFIFAIIQNNWVSVIFIFVIACLIFLPMMIARLSHIDLPIALEMFAVIFIYASLFLGELNNYYAKFFWWDILLHIGAGLAFGVMGFIILYILYKTKKVKTSPKMIAMFTFAFALAIGALWEIVEFSIDQLFGPISNHAFMQTQVNNCGLIDTMKDLIDDSIGALFTSIMGYLYLKWDSGIVIKQMTKEFKKDNPRLFKKRKK
jgi:uncharacterized membrane protein YjdF